MALSSLTQLDQYKAAPFPPGYPDTTRTFYSPVDQVHGALKALLASANKRIVVAMYGYDRRLARRNGPMDSHAEMRALHRRNSIGWSAHLDSRCSLAPKDVEQEFARRTAESSRKFAWSSRHPLVVSGPLNLQPTCIKPPTQVVAAAANVSPQRGIHCGREASGTLLIGSAEVLVMNKVFIEIGQGPHPPDAEEADGRAGPDPGDEPRQVPALSQSLPALLGELLEGAR
jgi:hypothetical protein